MVIDIKTLKPSDAVKFAAEFLPAYMSPAFGALSKAEVDRLVFSSLIKAGALDPEAPTYDIARALNIAPARVRSLVLNWQLRSTPAQRDLRSSIVDALKNTRFSNDGKLLTFGVESPLLREDIIARLKRKGVFPEASFSKELVKLPAEAFVEFLDEIVNDETKKQVRARLIKDKQIANTSFKGIATSVLVKLGSKIADKGGGVLAEKAASLAADKALSFITGLLTGDVRAATKSLDGDDLIEA